MYHSPFNALKVLNDVYKNSLNDDETIYSPISLINIPLRRHQHAIVEQMKKCELDFSKGVTYENNAIFSKYAILGDNVGVGKTLMVLSHIAQIRQQPALNFTSFHKDSNTNFYTLTKSVNDMSNAGCLVIVPHTLFRQWNDEIVSKTTKVERTAQRNLSRFAAKNHINFAVKSKLELCPVEKVLKTQIDVCFRQYLF